MSRDLDAAVEAALASSPYRPVLIGRLDIEDDPVHAWTGPGIFAPTGTSDAALNDLSYDPAEAFIDITPVREDMGNGGPLTITLSGTDLDDDLLRQVVRDKRAWRLKPAYLWVGILDTDMHSVIGEPFRMKTGVIAAIETVRRADTAIVRVTIDEDLGRARSAPCLIRDHARVWPGDTYSTYLGALANKPGGLEATDLHRPGAGLGVGSAMAGWLWGR